MASESHTTVLPSTRQGTLPEGENERKWLELPSSPKGLTCSSKGMPSSRISNHGRSDQEE
jgi:hypothetical protein